MSAGAESPAADVIVAEISDVLAHLAERGLTPRRAVGVLLGMAAKIAKHEKGDACEDEFVEAARFYYRKLNGGR